ncbi:glycosyltransferase [Sphingobium limneticum]|uniref:glycosyltransferase n=1 Tax=Sphingobium limneticum TaxID=1007511 RepID=UPI003CFDBB07
MIGKFTDLFQLGAAIRASRLAKRSYSQADWNKAVDLWRRVARAAPRSSRVLLQYAQALRRAGDLQESATTYEAVLQREPGSGLAWLGLGIARKGLGLRSAAIKAFVEASRVAPELKGAAEELVNYGARDERRTLAPREKLVADAMEGMALSLRQAHQWWDALADHSSFGLRDYDQVRSTLHIPVPPAAETWTDPQIDVWIDARSASPTAIRITLQSLLDQQFGRWTATVIPAAEIELHPVASLADSDKRIRFGSSPSPQRGDWTLRIDAGTSLHSSALSWFAWASMLGVEAVYSDHDHVTRDWKHGSYYRDPVFQPMFDPHWFSDGEVAPAALLFRRGRDADRPMVDLLREVGDTGAVAHIPLPLATRDMRYRPALPKPARPERDGDERICVIIPTRDNAGLLERAVASLIDLAASPERVEFIIMSNRPALDESLALLCELDQQPSTRIVQFDEPFNWSRANNLAARLSDADILLFLNDDTEMLTRYWDRVLLGAMSRDGRVGIVGALMEYPAGGIQHAGIMMGLNGDGPQHEGRWQDGEIDGPGGRWKRRHLSSAVTGAFMAMTRDLFEELGGFDEKRFAIAYNDVDMCLRVRESGRQVLYCPQLRLIHHESISRGVNLTPEMLEWDQGELTTLREIWGATLFTDPAYNPNFVGADYPHGGYRHPTGQEVEAHTRRSAAPDPWRAARQGDRPDRRS